jgi:hypothetical protein
MQRFQYQIKADTTYIPNMKKIFRSKVALGFVSGFTRLSGFGRLAPINYEFLQNHLRVSAESFTSF